jgi:hypothetical protein
VTNVYATLDNLETTTPGHAQGAGSLALAAGYGATIQAALTASGRTISATSRLVVSTFTAGGAPCGIYSAQGLSGDTLTGLTLLYGADATLAPGAIASFRWTAEHAAQLAAAINAAEAAIAALQANDVADEATIASHTTSIAANTTAIGLRALDSAVVHTSGAETIAGVKTFSSTILGSVSGNAGTATLAAGLSAPIAESQVTNLVSDLASKAPVLIPTAVKTANYAAIAGDFVLASTTGGAFTITLPAAPADKTTIGAKLVVAGNTLTATAGGTDKFNAAGGSTSVTMGVLRESAVWQYQASTGLWVALSNDAPISQLDLRYAAIAAPGSTGQVIVNSAGAFGGAALLTYATSGTIHTVAAGAIGDTILAVKAFSGQTANLQEWQASTGTAFAAVSPTKLLGPAGSVIAGQGPGIAFFAWPNDGMASNGSNLGFWQGGTLALNINTSATEYRLPSNFYYSWSSATNNNAAADTQFSRAAAGVIQLGVGSTYNSLKLGAASASTVALAVRGFTSQTADLTQWQTPTGTTLAGVDANGYIRVLTGSGAPSGTPSDGALYLDITNFKLYARCGGAWKSSAAFT